MTNSPTPRDVSDRRAAPLHAGPPLPAAGDATVPSHLLLIAGPATDHELVLALLRDCLPGMWFTVHAEIGLDDALARLSAETFDLVLADVSQLPGEQGAVAAALRAAHPTTPLMIVTGSTAGGFDLWARLEGVRPEIAQERPAAEHAATPVTHPGEGGVAMQLRAALASGGEQLVLHYQPVVNLTSGHVIAVEALVRWAHPTLGLVGPDHFIAAAESSGLIHELGDWVLNRAVRDAPLLTHGGRELDIAVNFSVLQLNDQTVLTVQQALASSGLRPGRLTIEVTESALIVDEDTAVRSLEAIAGLGVDIAIDDFGTGYSSLHYLRRYPITIIKIDREFVAGIGRPTDDEAICHSIVNLASAVGATSIGEGVETAEQYAVLRSMGCDHGQGFLWAGPLPVDRLAATFTACEEISRAAMLAQSSQTANLAAPR